MNTEAKGTVGDTLHPVMRLLFALKNFTAIHRANLQNASADSKRATETSFERFRFSKPYMLSVLTRERANPRP
jgi:hypothetical protein